MPNSTTPKRVMLTKNERERYDTLSKTLNFTVTRYKSKARAGKDADRLFDANVLGAVVRSPRDGYYEVRTDNRSFEHAQRVLHRPHGERKSPNRRVAKRKK